VEFARAGGSAGAAAHRLATGTASDLAADNLVEKLDGGLRILVADENVRALDDVAAILRELGHEVVARATSLSGASSAIAEDKPNIAMVKLHGDDQHALDLIQELIDSGGCPVVALLDTEDPEFVGRAAERGIIAYAQPVDEESVRSSLEIAVRRFSELSELGDAVDELEDAIARRATIERAKGILMERHGVSDQKAFEMLRAEARSSNRRVHDVAADVA
jgi:AmiR/NasT family two-component response regulator